MPPKLQRQGMALIVMLFWATAWFLRQQEMLPESGQPYWPPVDSSMVFQRRDYASREDEFPEAGPSSFVFRVRENRIVAIEKPSGNVPINSVDSSALLRYGMRPFAIQQFLRLRHRWGGWYQKSSVPEVVLSVGWDWVYDGQPVPLVLNHTPIEGLARHPAIGWERAKAIERYRSRLRPFRRWEELYSLPGWDSASVEQVRPYIVVNQKDSVHLPSI